MEATTSKSDFRSTCYASGSLLPRCVLSPSPPPFFVLPGIQRHLPRPRSNPPFAFPRRFRGAVSSLGLDFGILCRSFDAYRATSAVETSTNFLRSRVSVFAGAAGSTGPSQGRRGTKKRETGSILFSSRGSLGRLKEEPLLSWLQLDFSFVAGGRALAGYYWLGDDHGLCENYHLGSLWEIRENTAEV